MRRRSARQGAPKGHLPGEFFSAASWPYFCRNESRIGVSMSVDEWSWIGFFIVLGTMQAIPFEATRPAALEGVISGY